MTGTVGTVLREAAYLLLPVRRAAKGGMPGVESLLVDAGVDVDAEDRATVERIRSILVEMGGEVSTLYEGIVVDEQLSPAKVPEYVRTVRRIVEDAESLSNVPLDSFEDDRDLLELLLDHLVVEYLALRQPSVLETCLAFGVVDYGGRGERHRVYYGRIGALFSDPGSALAEGLNWGDQFDGRQLLRTLREVTTALLGGGSYAYPAIPEVLTSVLKDADTPVPETAETFHGEEQPRTLVVPILDTPTGPAGIKVVFLPKLSGSQETRLVVIPFGVAKLSAGKTYEVADVLSLEWSFSGTGSFDAYGLEFSPGSPPTPLDLKGGSETSTDVDVSVSRTDSDPPKLPVFGTGDGSGLRIAPPGLNLGTALGGGGGGGSGGGGPGGIDLSLPTTGALSVSPSGGFLESVLPGDLSVDFDFEPGWSSGGGLYLGGGASLETSIPLDLKLGPVTMQEVFLSLGIEGIGGGGGGGGGGGPGGGIGSFGGLDLPLTVATSIETELGPFAVTVRRIGLSVDASLSPELDGDLGPLDLDVSFQPPKGLGLELNAGPVGGGGFVEHFPDDGRYSGSIQLQVGSYTIGAVGLLETDLPNLDAAYSFTLLITAELPPIQLGFGFTLNGVGGLVGVNRSFKTKALGKAVRTGSLGSVLFPEDVVANAGSILSDLGSVFPSKVGNFVVGPMAKFGWGTPTLLELDLGVVLSIPDWVVALVGKLSIQLPDEALAIVDLKLAATGVLDVPGKRVSIDASLYDSRVAMFSIKGDMALRSKWGDGAKFMLSIGGFHPRYEPPKSFPDLDRLQAWIPGLGGNLRVRMSGYLAVTPNTFQVGANTLVHAEAGPAEVHGELGFDALFQFNPFKFVFDFRAEFSATLWGHGLTIRISGTIRGPKPLNVGGKVTIDLPLLPAVSAHVDVSIGEPEGDEKLPEVKVFGKLIDEFETGANWQGQLPSGGPQFVTIRGPDGDGGKSGSDGPVLVHPLGGIAVRQTVVPLSYRIGKFGNARPATFEQFEVPEIRICRDEGRNRPLTDRSKLQEKFAPGKYRKMDDGSRLDSEAFVEQLAGYRAGGDLYHEPATADCTTASLTYETRVTDEEANNRSRDLASMGQYRDPKGGRGRPEEARTGVSEETAASYLPLTAAGRARPEGRSFSQDPATRVGVPEDDSGTDDDGVANWEGLK